MVVIRVGFAHLGARAVGRSEVSRAARPSLQRELGGDRPLGWESSEPAYSRPLLDSSVETK
jgi:hypothetical protein